MRGVEHGRLGFQPMPEEMFHHYSEFMAALAQENDVAIGCIHDAAVWIDTEIDRLRNELLANNLKISGAFNAAISNIFRFLSNEAKEKIFEGRQAALGGNEATYLSELKRVNKAACDLLYESMIESY